MTHSHPNPQTPKPALVEALTEAEGWKLVPVYMTDAMVFAVNGVRRDSVGYATQAYMARHDYTKALAAAPLPPDPATPPEGGETLREALEAVAYGICGACGRTNDPKTHCTLSDEDADAGCDGRKCFWATVPDAQGLALAALSASQTPAPAAGQGADALKPGLEMALKLCERARDGGYLANARDCCREVQKALDAIHHAKATQTAPVAHPTTRQETVATPRDGGVREALKHAITQARGALRLDAMCDENGNPYGTTTEALLALDAAEAALSAPGSAGPGETRDAIKAATIREAYWIGMEVAFEEAKRVVWGNPSIGEAHAILENRLDGARRQVAALATPTTVQPNTGETGDGWQPIATAPKDGDDILLFSEAWSMSWGIQIGRYDGGEWHTGEGSVAENDADFDPNAEVDDDFDPDQNSGPTHWMPLPKEPSPATTAETPGPADQTKGGL